MSTHLPPFLSEDDDYERDYRNQRHRPEAPPGTRIKRGLLDIADDVNGRPPRDTKESAIHIAKLAAEHWDDEYVRDTFGTVIMKLYVTGTWKKAKAALVEYGY